MKGSTFGLGLKYFKTASSPFSVCRVEAFQDSDDSKLVRSHLTCCACLRNIREIKIHVHAKRQTSDSSWEFLRIENKQIKTVQNKFSWIKLAWNHLFLCRSKKQ